MKQTNTMNQNTPYSDAIEFLKQKRYELANIGISSKTAFDWRGNGIYLEEKKTKYRMKYSAIEYIWLLLVKELREFGLPLKSVLSLKEFLLLPINVEKLLSSIQDDSDLDNEVIQELGGEIGIFTGSKKELKQAVNEIGQYIVDSMFISMITSTLLNQENYVLLIKKDGVCFIEEINSVERSTDLIKRNTVSGSCIRIPLKNLVLDFLKKEQIDEYDLTDKDEPLSVIEELDFMLKDASNKISSELKTRLKQLMMDGNFTEIMCITEDGKKVNVNNPSSKKE